MSHQSAIVGIDLGTTNSSIGVMQDGRPVLIPVDGDPLLPSVVGLGADGTLLVGQAARHQYLLYPDRTIRSIKRRMGEDIRLRLGDHEYTPVEISAMILRRLKSAAEEYLKMPVDQAVITVPAYFSDVQRTWTKEAGEIAGFEVKRIFNEPTAAALCYATEDPKDQTVMVFDLGGGTFDVSIVRTRGQVTEVLASHGDTALGGDDFDAALMTRLRRLFEDKAEATLADNLRALARISRATEEAKIRLSIESYTQVIEEHLAERDGVGLHLDEEVARHDYEELIEPFLDRTKDSVQIALREAGVLARDLDEIILVGGSTRTPRIKAMLHELLGIMPRMDIDPEKAVALGATLQAARIGGLEGHRILVDVTPFSFGTSYLGFLNGVPSPHCYKAIISRNSPLPTRQTEVFYTMVDGQESVDVHVYQGEDENARNNLHLGQFWVKGLDPDALEGSPILFDMKLNLDGILEVEVIEKHTGLKKKVIIEDAFRKLSAEEIAASRNRISHLFGEEDGEAADRIDDSQNHDALPFNGGSTTPAAGTLISIDGGVDGDFVVNPPIDPAWVSPDEEASWSKARSLLEKAAHMAPALSNPDRQEVEEIANQLKSAMDAASMDVIRRHTTELADVLFYLE